MIDKKRTIRQSRKNRVRSKIFGTHERPRLCVFRSLKYTYAQVINDETGKVIVSADSRKFLKNKVKKVDAAHTLGLTIAEKCKEHKVHEVVFDRSSYKYHGRVKAVAQGAREGGLKF